MQSEKLKIKEAIVVEGRDDTIAINRALDCITIETHGFGIKKETWEILEKAYNEKGLIVFTDPDFSGEEIRRKIMAKFPDSKEAFLTRGDATKKGDIGIENAEPEAIINAIKKAHFTEDHEKDEFTMDDLVQARLAGDPEAAIRREKLGKLLGIGYSNAKTLLKKLNKYNISREEFEAKLKEI